MPLLLQSLDESTRWSHGFACVPESGLGTVRTVRTNFAQGWPPDSSVRAFSHTWRPDSVAHLSFHAIQQPASIMGTGPVQIHRVQFPSMNPPTIHWHCTGRIGSCLGYGPSTQGRAPFRLEAVLGCWTGLGTLDRNFPSFALPWPKHQTNRARNFCPSSRTTVAQFRHMAQGVPLHWLRPGKAVICSPVAPWTPFRILCGTVSCRMYSLLDRVLLNPARTSRVFSIRHPLPSSTSLPPFDVVLLTQTSRVPTSHQTRRYQCTIGPQTRPPREFVLPRLASSWQTYRHSHARSAQKFLSVNVNVNINVNASASLEAGSQILGGVPDSWD